MPNPALLPTLRQWAANISPGGCWDGGGLAGLWHLYLGNDRSCSSGGIGVRPEELAALIRDAEEAPRLRAVSDAAKALFVALDSCDPAWRSTTLGVSEGDDVNTAWDALAAALVAGKGEQK